MEWELVGVGNSEPLEEREDGGQLLVLPLNPNTTELNGTMFLCRVTSTNGQTYEKIITLTVRGKKYTVLKLL